MAQSSAKPRRRASPRRRPLGHCFRFIFIIGILAFPHLSNALFIGTNPTFSAGPSQRPQDRIKEESPAGRMAEKDETAGTSLDSAAIKLHQQGIVSQAQGNFADSERLYREALKVWETLPATASWKMIITLNGLGNLLRIQGHYPEAQQLFRRAISIGEKSGAPARLDLALSFNSMGALYCNQNRPTRAAPFLESALTIREQVLGPEHPLIGASLVNLADALVEKHRLDAAEALYRRALKLLQTTTDYPLSLAAANYKLAELYFHHRKRTANTLSEAEVFYRRSIQMSERVLENNHPLVGLAITGLGEVAAVQSRYPEAELLFKQALDIQEHALGPTHVQVAKILLEYASILRKQHRRRQAAPMEKRARNILKKSARENTQYATVDLNTLERSR